MSNDNFRRDLNRAFDEMSGPPSPALSARIRAALNERAPERPAPFWIAGVAAALIAAIVIGLFVIANFNRRPTGIAPVGPPTASPTVVATPTPDSNLPPFQCNSSGIGSGPTATVAYIDAVRTGTHPGYDRLTIEFQNGDARTVEFQMQSSANFTQGASGQPVTLKGSAGLLVTIRGADEHTAYSGPTDLNPGYSVLVEARQVQDFEGLVQWALGLSKPACYRAFYLTNPTRLVIDIQVT